MLRTSLIIYREVECFEVTFCFPISDRTAETMANVNRSKSAEKLSGRMFSGIKLRNASQRGNAICSMHVQASLRWATQVAWVYEVEIERSQHSRCSTRNDTMLVSTLGPTLLPVIYRLQHSSNTNPTHAQGIPHTSASLYRQHWQKPHFDCSQARQSWQLHGCLPLIFCQSGSSPMSDISTSSGKFCPAYIHPCTVPYHVRWLWSNCVKVEVTDVKLNRSQPYQFTL